MKAKDIPQKWLICKDFIEWRAWLMANHRQESEVWLQIRKVKSEAPGPLLKEAVEEALCFGWIDGKMYSLDDQKFIIRMTPRRQESKWSLINRRRAEKLIKEGRMMQAGLEAVNWAKHNGAWEGAYTSKIVPELPDDLMAALWAEPNALKNFMEWPNNQKMQAVTWVQESRHDKTRAYRIDFTVELAKAGRHLT